MSLKESTHLHHVAAEAHAFTKLLVSKKVSPEIYYDYLCNQLAAYTALEKLCANKNVFEFLPQLQRTTAIQKDIQELTTNASATKTYPATAAYVEYLNTATNKQLLAHLYVRHMGDLYGGQLIKKCVPGSGTMYDFENRQELIKSLRSQLTDDLADEANLVFGYVLQLFTELANEHNIQ
jgi:heme oxygenase